MADSDAAQTKVNMGWKPQMLEMVKGDDRRLRWLSSRVRADQDAFTAIVNFLSDRHACNQGWMRACRLLAPDGTVAAVHYASFIQYEDRKRGIVWNRITIEGDKS